LIVLDASALIELVLATATGKSLADRIASPDLGLHVPHLADVEVTQVLRRYAGTGGIDPATAERALDTLRALDLQRHAHEPLLGRIWALRDNLSAYDATYVALAEVLDCTLLTSDARLARAPGATCRIELLA